MVLITIDILRFGDFFFDTPVQNSAAFIRLVIVVFYLVEGDIHITSTTSGK